MALIEISVFGLAMLFLAGMVIGAIIAVFCTVNNKNELVKGNKIVLADKPSLRIRKVGETCWIMHQNKPSLVRVGWHCISNGQNGLRIVYSMLLPEWSNTANGIEIDCDCRIFDSKEELINAMAK